MQISVIVLVILLPSTFLTKIHPFFQSVLVHKYQFTCVRACVCICVYVSSLSRSLVRRIMVPDYHLITISFPSHYRTSFRCVRARVWTFASGLQLFLLFTHTHTPTHTLTQRNIHIHVTCPQFCHILSFSPSQLVRLIIILKVTVFGFFFFFLLICLF